MTDAGAVDLNLPYTYPERYGVNRDKVRYRVERTIGGKTVKRTLKGEPGSAAWIAHREQIIEQIEGGERPATSGYRKGQLGWLCGEFIATMEKREAAGLISAATLRRYRLQLGRLCEARTPKGIPAAEAGASIPRSEFIKIRDTLLGTPAAADSFTKTVRLMYNWAKDGEVFTCPNPAERVSPVDTKTEGYRIWTIDEIRKYLDHHEPGTLARLTMVAELCTGARRGDLCALGDSDVIDVSGTRWIKWRQEKPPHLVVEIPMLDMLAEELERRPIHGDTWICRTDGTQRSKKAFGMKFATWRNEAGLEGTDREGKSLSLHGIRKGVASILPEFGVSEYMVDVLLGHELGSGTSRIYTRGAQRRQIAVELNEAWRKVRWT